MRRCIYCKKIVHQSDLTLEHVIPQFLGGAYAPDWLKTRDVCQRCNNNLGLFVDAGFEKDWVVSSTLSMAAHKTYDPSAGVGLPLICMGLEDVPLPAIQPDECFEVWLGPAGERVFWVRPVDESLYWYMGGIPGQLKLLTRARTLCFLPSHTQILGARFRRSRLRLLVGR
ncbi:HNH endonuclease [Cupriavidus sp. 8B]